jgi:site-specific DNA-adenine methylase
VTDTLFDLPIATPAAPKVTALVPWYGAKRSMAGVIAGELGRHRSYWEPFCGSMAVLLAKDPVVTETVNDLHQDLVNLARVIQDPKLGPALYRRLRRAGFSQALFADARSLCDGPFTGESPDIDRAFAYFDTTSTFAGGSRPTAGIPPNVFHRPWTRFPRGAAGCGR